MEVEGRQLLAALPAVIRIDVEVVALQDQEAGGVEGFVAVGDLDSRGLAFGVFGAAAQEAADDELVDAPLVRGEGGWDDVVDGVDGWVGLVVVAA